MESLLLLLHGYNSGHLLTAYSYEIEFRPPGEHGNADSLFHFPLGCRVPPETGCEFIVGQIHAPLVTAAQVVKATRQDPVSGKVHCCAKEGCPTNVPEEYQSFWNHCWELSIERQCLLLGNRVIIPSKVRARVLEELHKNHPDMTRMKVMERSHMWWPHLDKDFENHVKACVPCQAVRDRPASPPLHLWLWPTRPRLRVHVNFAGPFKGICSL